MESENKQDEIEAIHKNIIQNLQAEISTRKKIYNFRKQFPHMIATLTALQKDKVRFEKQLSKIEVALFMEI